ncbi:cobalt-precorrin-7 (C(5))-methyltransferase [Carnobacteriaceae bacterium zg-ZUI78]|uniref:cobalt-precorrin-7 (C(5))-methyltransferase n=1 Tax=Granulicatella sp. zg-84 TaxID=2678503 RepID=UPI0013BF70B0|nr:cobalt-precorrin-7 (C(5))-methyltransferase [Granulicatella sp. zg-84]MBS4749716.1 cobalt-precorrin-7 (C(5))-methyltransferase [Carnobacteriaceae bacterium zg-ZUI78]NEW65919.1 cobalt-precorrin-7 (C(5))-methyltransferase [Granulicatella sp. zg-84]QMI85147.1 cobalt-precorrin-7 (C(5))-methyltransferase [Carnobacteriaceae bacterium zg-84]
MGMIYVIGIGPGDTRYGLLGHEDLFKKADYIIGSDRHLEILPEEYAHKGVVPPKKLLALEELLRSYDEDKTLVYLASGDPLIYGLGKWLSEKFKGQVEIMPGVSAMQYLASKAFIPMNDAYLTSSHAKIPNFDLIMSLSKVFMVTDDHVGPYQIAQEAVQRGLNKRVIIGENLSYDDEKITSCLAQDVEDREYKMNVVVIMDER